MNRNDFRDLNCDWDAEKARRLRHIRRAKARMFFDAVVNAAIALLALVALVWLVHHVARRPVEERAAYLEGRFGIDHATAMVYASADRGESWSWSSSSRMR